MWSGLRGFWHSVWMSPDSRRCSQLWVNDWKDSRRGVSFLLLTSSEHTINFFLSCTLACSRRWKVWGQQMQNASISDERWLVVPISERIHRIEHLCNEPKAMQCPRLARSSFAILSDVAILKLRTCIGGTRIYEYWRLSEFAWVLVLEWILTSGHHCRLILIFSSQNMLQVCQRSWKWLGKWSNFGAIASTTMSQETNNNAEHEPTVPHNRLLGLYAWMPAVGRSFNSCLHQQKDK
jgi:hypothetical protein